MNINQAKQQIKNSIIAYFEKDKYGNYVIPVEKQRPIFLMGAPGIGKTAIMEQIASELKVGLVSYSMTHHTRQSALGLPFITKKNYGGVEYEVSEYTMSEIIASVYELMETTGCKEGILFLDEINCVSETLAPAMLQFLQYKVFGRHTVPKGWIVVTAGNPPEYNNSVREFDIVTWDRLKRVDVEEDYKTWKNYALNHNTHPAIISYLDVKPTSFYKIETTVDGKSFVTARGWSDLSDIMNLYEQKGIKIDINLIKQYLQNKQIAGEFAAYYDLFVKYKSDYQIASIVSGNPSQSIIDRAKKSKFDEQVALISLLVDALINNIESVTVVEKSIKSVIEMLKPLKTSLTTQTTGIVEKTLKQFCETTHKQIEKDQKASMISKLAKKSALESIVYAEKLLDVVQKSNTDDKATYEVVKKIVNFDADKWQQSCREASEQLTNVFHFISDCFGDGAQMTIYITELTTNTVSANFIMYHGNSEYTKYTQKYNMTERVQDIENQLKLL